MSTPPASVLVVSADAAVQTLLQTVIGADGHTIVAVDSVAAALPHLTSDFTLILVASPSEPGDERWDEIERLHAVAGAVPVVLLSESGAVPFAGYHERGFAGLIITPCDPDDLSTTLRPLLRTQEIAA
jgi:DNA-binding NtrC family response regulator